MNDPAEGIIDLYNEMSKEGLAKDREKVQVYVGREIWNEISQNMTSEVNLGHSPLEGFNPRSPGFVDDTEEMTYTEVHSSQFYGMTAIEEPRLDDNEVLMIDVGGLQFPSDSPGSLILSNPVCIQKHHFVPTKQKERCQECGSLSDTCVEGDDGELYCSIACLNEAYNG